MNLVVVAPGPHSRGGICSVVQMLRPGLETRFITADVDCSREGTFAEKVIHFLRAISKSLRIIKKSRGGVAYLHTAFGRVVFRDIVFLYLFKFFGFRAVIHVHSFYNPWFAESLLVRVATRFILRRSDHVVTFSKDLHKELARHCIPCSIVHNPAPDLQISEAPREDIVIFAGTLTLRKGVDLLSEVIASSREDLPSLRFEIYGSGQFEPLCFLKKKMPERVDLKGFINNRELRIRLGYAKALILPSRHEGMPIVILEALALGTPVVATEVGAIPEISENNKILQLCQPDARSLLEGLKKIVNSRPAREEYIRWHEDFSRERISQKISSILSSVLEK
jgi:glycosyltransferase involved in cell wall biosynthesis